MSSTSDREQQDDTASTAPGSPEQRASSSTPEKGGPDPASRTAPTAAVTDATGATAPGDDGASTGSETDDSSTADPAAAVPTRPDTQDTPSASSRAPRAHRATRPTPVPPAPEEPLPSVVPEPASGATGRTTSTAGTTAVISSDGSGAPTTPVPTSPPSEPVRRTSIRGAEARAAAVLTAGSATPVAAEPADAAATPTGTAAEADLPGTGPSDASVPYGDASAPHVESEPIAPRLPGDAVPEAQPTAPSHRREGAADTVRRPGGGTGRHLLGVLVGLVVGAIGVWVTVFGQARILGAQAPGWDASYEPLGVILVTVGVLVLATVLALGLWTPAVPLTAGGAAAVIGVVFLYVPASTQADTIRWIASDGTLVSVTRTTVTATSGAVFVIGALLLAGGLTLAVARRRWLPRD